jgi:hypothetical protein
MKNGSLTFRCSCEPTQPVQLQNHWDLQVLPAEAGST